MRVTWIEYKNTHLSGTRGMLEPGTHTHSIVLNVWLNWLRESRGKTIILRNFTHKNLFKITFLNPRATLSQSQLWTLFYVLHITQVLRSLSQTVLICTTGIPLLVLCRPTNAHTHARANTLARKARNNFGANKLSLLMRARNCTQQFQLGRRYTIASKMKEERVRFRTIETRNIAERNILSTRTHTHTHTHCHRFAIA